jgi:hypothetical protein
VHKRRVEQAPAAVPDAPFVLDPNAILFPDQFRRLFRLRASTLRREVREGRLTVYQRGGRYYLLGSEILAWLRGGLVTPRRRRHEGNGQAPESPAAGKGVDRG